MVDPLSDMFTRIRNANMVSKTTVSIPYSQLKTRILNILIKSRFIYRFEVINRTTPKSPLKNIIVYLRYHNKQKAITNLKRVSTKKHLVYVGRRNIPYVRNGFGLVIISTPKGLMSGKEAFQAKIGGKILGYVW